MEVFAYVHYDLESISWITLLVSDLAHIPLVVKDGTLGNVFFVV